MSRYVDAYVLPVKKSSLDAYRKLAQEMGAIWKEYGALEYMECAADDVKMGTLTSFPRAVHLTEDEIVVVSWIVFESREQRDAINAKVMDDPRISGLMDTQNLPFDGKRMFWGGFKPIVEL